MGHFAHGALATIAAYLFYTLHIQHGLSWPVSAAISVLGAGVAVGLAFAQLYKLPKGDTFGGLTPPITYSGSGGPQPPSTCFFEIQLKSGSYAALNNAKPVCAS